VSGLRSFRRAALAAGALMLWCVNGAHAQTAGWKPDKNVEVVVGVAAGGSMDRTARDVQKFMQEKRLLPVPSTVMNKPGGGHVIALTYLNMHAGDAHYLQVVNTPLLTNRILGRGTISYKDYTPIAVLFDELEAFAVRTDSPIKNGHDLIERLRRDPAALSISVSTGVGTANQIAAVLMAKAAGIDPKKLKAVAFNSAAEGVTAALGGHVDVAITTAFSIMPLVETGKLRFVAIASAQRLGGALAQVPTWREQGIDSVVGAWRAVIAPRGLNASQIAYWDGIFAKLTALPEWKADVAANYLTDTYMNSSDARRFFDTEDAKYTAVLTAAGMAKTPAP
jgi:putative tricarboxylic transport membrane protein